MLEAYSLNVTVPAATNIPFNNITLEKGCTVDLNGVSTIELNKCGVYMIAFDGSLGTATTVQLYKDGVALPQAQSTGASPSFVTLVQVSENNSRCCCTSPTLIQIRNTGTAAATFTDVNVCVTKVC